MSKTRLLILKDSEKFIVNIFLSRDSLEVFGNMDAKEKRDVFDVFFKHVFCSLLSFKVKVLKLCCLQFLSAIFKLKRD